MRPLLLLSLLFALVTAPARAQFTELVATDDGKQLFFTSQLLLKGVEASSPFPETRLYRATSSGVQMVAERGPLAIVGGYTSSDGVNHPSLSGDGSVVGFTFSNICKSAADCTGSYDMVMVRGAQTFNLGPGTVQVSRNGHWALVTNEYCDSSDPAGDRLTVRSLFVDLSTGRWTVPTMPSEPPYHMSQRSTNTLASDGSMLIMKPDPSRQQGVGGVMYYLFGILKEGQFTPVPATTGVAADPFAVTDDAGTVFSYGYPANVNEPVQCRLVAISMATGKATIVFEAKDASQMPIFMASSNNGSRVLYRVASATAQYALHGAAYVWDAATGAGIAVPLAAGELATAGTVSGDGSTAFVATTKGRIVRFDVAAKTATDVFPAVPYCDDPGPVAGGSLVRLHCPLLTATSTMLQVAS